MVVYKLIVSNEAPSHRACIWAKPVSGGFNLFYAENGTWRPLTLDAATSGAVEEAAVEDAVAAVTGKNTDTADKMTLYGLKAWATATFEPKTP